MIALLVGVLSLQDPQPVVPKAGKFRGEIVDPVKKDVIMKVRMAIPETRPEGKTWGFIFVCHGFQGHENNSYLDGTVAALKRLGLDQQYLAIAGKSKGEGWTEEDDERFLRLYAWAKENYPVDPKRLFLFGSSNGARFVNRFGSLHQEIVSGVVSYCGSFDLSKMAEPAEKRTEWYYVHGGKDNPRNSRKMCDELQKRGYRYVFRQLDGYGHTDIWDGKGHPDKSLVDAVCDDWAAWLHALPHAAPAGTEKDLKVLETAARWRIGGAQAALCERAKGKEIAAIEALGRAAKLMFAGNFEDKKVIWTLVDLAGSADPKAAEAARSVLRAAVPDSAEFTPERWKEWATQNCGAPQGKAPFRNLVEPFRDGEEKIAIQSTEFRALVDVFRHRIAPEGLAEQVKPGVTAEGAYLKPEEHRGEVLSCTGRLIKIYTERLESEKEDDFVYLGILQEQSTNRTVYFYMAEQSKDAAGKLIEFKAYKKNGEEFLSDWVRLNGVFLRQYIYPSQFEDEKGNTVYARAAVLFVKDLRIVEKPE